MPKQRDLVLIAVPYSDLSTFNQRLILVLSSDAHLRRSPDMLGVVLDAVDMEVGSLPRPSLIRADKIHNLSQAKLIKPYGVLNKITSEKVLAELDIVLGR